jgi:hypothetical protein
MTSPTIFRDVSERGTGVCSCRVGKRQGIQETTSMTTKVFYMDELFGELISDEEFAAMTADQLREAIIAYDRTVVREPDGSYNMIDESCGEYEFIDDDESAFRTLSASVTSSVGHPHQQ